MFDPSGARFVSDGHAQHPAEQPPCRRARRDLSCHSTRAAFGRCRTVRGPVRINRRQRRAAGWRWTLADAHDPLPPLAKAKGEEAAGKPSRSEPAHVSRASAVAAIPRQPRRYEPIRCPALLLISRCEDSWEWAAAPLHANMTRRLCRVAGTEWARGDFGTGFTQQTT